MKYVVKIGGSLYARPELGRVLARVADLIKAPHGAIIVPGGGPFAHQVRRAQKRWLFADQTAHRMALLAMRQYGHMIATLAGLPATERTQDAAAHGGTVWLPSEDCRAWLPEDRPPPDFDWHLTSDSVAACLARRIGAKQLLLIKAVSAGGVGGVGEMGDLVDERFCGLVTGSGMQVGCVSAKEWIALERIDDLAGYLLYA